MEPRVAAKAVSCPCAVLLAAALLAVAPGPSSALEPELEDVYVRVADVGTGERVLQWS